MAGIYSPAGQHYKPVDAGTIAPYREAEDGQILQEGICETGAMASFLAAGTAYANYGLPMVPFYIFYSMFGFQRVGDMIWACGDMMCKGFLLGGTSGRTTLNGEGVQHQDGHSHLIAATVPNLVSYDPVAVRVRGGGDRPRRHPAHVCGARGCLLLPDADQSELRDAADARRGGGRHRARHVRLAARAGRGRQPARERRHRDGGPGRRGGALEELGKRVNVWSVTSYTELARQGTAAERAQMLTAGGSDERPYVEALLEGEEGVFVAASDYMKALPLSIARWFPGAYTVLGTDGYGLSGVARLAARLLRGVPRLGGVRGAVDLGASQQGHRRRRLGLRVDPRGLDLDKAAPS